MEHIDKEPGFAEDGLESKQNLMLIPSFPQYNQPTEPGLFLQQSVGSSSPNTHIPVQIQQSSSPNTHIPAQIQQSSFALNTNTGNSSKYFFEDEGNLPEQANSYGVMPSGDASLLADKPSYKEFGETRHNCLKKIDTCQSVDLDGQRSHFLSKDSSNNHKADSEQFEHTSILSVDNYNVSLLPSYKQVTQVSHNAEEYLVIEGSNEKYVIEKALIGNNDCEDGKNFDIVEAVENNIKKCNTFSTNSDKLHRTAVDVAEETVAAIKTHCCLDKEGSSSSSYICGYCKTKFCTLCKLHDHLEKMHFTGTYIYYHSTRTGFPRLENACKFTQTDLTDILESDQAQFKDDEVNDTDEYDLETGLDIFDENVKTDGTVSNDKDDADNIETVKIKGRKNKRKRKKGKHKGGSKEGDISVIPGRDGTNRLRLYINRGKVTKTKDKTYKKSERYQKTSKGVKNSEVNKSTEIDEETDHDIDLPFQNSGNKSDQSDDACNSALKSDSYLNNVLCTYEKFTSLNDSLKKGVVKPQEKVLPSQLKRKGNKISKMKGSWNRIKENKSENSGSYNCGTCATKYISKEKLQYHMTKVHKEENTDGPKQCRWCGKSFPGSKSYKAHQRQCEKNEHLICLICDKKFNSRHEVADHLISHRNDVELKCRLCERTFTCEVTLQSHLRRHNQRKDLQCEHCGKAFYYHNLLKKHKLYCNREPDIDCPHCDLKFKTPESLKHHMSVHSSERPFVCHVCGYAAKKSMYLKRHLRCHTGERPYVCSECGMSFAAANGLNRHRKTHTNDKPCVCQYCGKSFTNNWNLKTHLRQHTGDTPYQCGQCGKAFKQNVLLKLHTKTHHPVETILLQ
ncbi:zinc finger protein 23-like [Mercenaria mercenaria]|uniref:zinc finger protein 23-like n=1 Tax=Mercenaria mercenaria TaxID=6596 RepID=UPI00234F4242|nr:zinc finger protein 23-like [Mercenaria mercenaria]XP_045208387.2 zinc finger protein 23-like [Mercenaria mercenaria]